ncbi:MAG TPA: 3-phosphoshikimate 1-carboxyvinyltransferase [Streptosporangiaceae bacterium]|nr:3-phosphoshikimate 1-carboxyvinyltransferase [Streptosporangiaceae bacterium]
MDKLRHGSGGQAPPWQAPHADGPVRARLRLPGSKSMTNRALVLAALANGPTDIINPLRARDSLLMAGALRALGATVDTGDSGTTGVAGAPLAQRLASSWRVSPGWTSADTRVDVGNAGTVMRFVPPVAALASVAVEFYGDPRASQRPVAAIIAALREIGAVIDDEGRGAIPFTVRGTGSLPGGMVTLDASASSQLVSGLLLAAPRYDKGLEVRHRGPRAPSAPHIAMTVQMLRDAGATVETATAAPGSQHAGPGDLPDTWFVHPGEISSRPIPVEPDLVNSAPFLAAALVTGGSVTILDWPAVTSQPAGQILDAFRAMGASCKPGPDGLTVTGTGAVRGITADLTDCSEISMVAGALAALADSPSVLTGIGHQRLQETDRLGALATEINALGGAVTELADGLEIRPRQLRASRAFATYDDHRLVMAAAVLGLVVPGLEVANAATVGKTFPEFPGMWAAMLERTP